MTPPIKRTALNIGSGPVHGTSIFTNVDEKAWPVDVCAKLPGLPFRDEVFEHIQCSHLIEHIKFDCVHDALLDLRRVLKVNGVMYLSCPDMERAEAVGSDEWIRYTVKGGVKEGWEHKWVSNVRLVRELLINAGFVPSWTKKVPDGWQANTHSWPLDFETRFLCRRSDFQWPQYYQIPYNHEVII